MWTIIWINENGADHYDRLENKEEVARCIHENNLQDDADTMIFPPEADDLWYPATEFSLESDESC